MGVAKVTFIPHHKNNHWPLALRHRTLAYASSFLIVTKMVAIAALALTPHVAQLSTITDSRILQLTNAAREDAGLPPLRVDTALAQAAKLKGQDMLKNQYFAHISPSGVTPWFWMQKTKYTYSVAGENLAIDFLDAEDAVAAWIASPTHKANLMHKDYTQTGIAVVSGEFQGGTSIIIVHMFGKPISEEAVPEEAPVETPETPAPTTLPATPAPVPENIAPRTPRIALVHTPADENDSAIFRVEGDKQHAAILLIQNQQRSITTLPDSESQDITIPAKNLPPGTIVAKVFTRSVRGIESAASNPVSFTNPEPKPVEEVQHSFALSPAFDQQQISLVGASSEHWQLFSLNSPIAIDAQVVSALPAFATKVDDSGTSFAASIVHATRQTTSLILVTVACLLMLAVIIKIRHQHPALIMHASLVILLATVLLSW